MWRCIPEPSVVSSAPCLAANHFALAGVVFGLLDPYADSDNTKIVQCCVLVFFYSYKSRMKDFQNKYE